MAYEIRNTFAEFVERLEDATGTGGSGLLYGVELFEGPLEKSIEHKDLPLLIYELSDAAPAEGIDTHFPKHARHNIMVLLSMYVAADKGYYTDDQDGLIDYYERVLDIIDGGDLTGSGRWGPETPKYKVRGFERDGLKNLFMIEVMLQSNRYERGKLQG